MALASSRRSRPSPAAASAAAAQLLWGGQPHSGWRGVASPTARAARHEGKRGQSSRHFAEGDAPQGALVRTASAAPELEFVVGAVATAAEVLECDGAAAAAAAATAFEFVVRAFAFAAGVGPRPAVSRPVG